jgi:hypothetical protein
MTKPVAWMDAGGRLYQFPDDADRGQTMRPLYLEQPTHPTKLLGPNLEQILNSAGFYRKREWEGLTDDFCYIEGSREAERITIPPKREWVGLTELEKAEITSLKWWDWEDTFDIDGFIKALEAKLKEKNNG